MRARGPGRAADRPLVADGIVQHRLGEPIQDAADLRPGRDVQRALEVVAVDGERAATAGAVRRSMALAALQLVQPAGSLARSPPEAVLSARRSANSSREPIAVDAADEAAHGGIGPGRLVVEHVVPHEPRDAAHVGRGRTAAGASPRAA